jgi:hypothetical protein
MYQTSGKLQVVPMALLNWATMSSFAAERSVPASLFASAWGKYVSA